MQAYITFKSHVGIRYAPFWTCFFIWWFPEMAVTFPRGGQERDWVNLSTRTGETMCFQRLVNVIDFHLTLSLTTLCRGFHYETYIGISPYRTLHSKQYGFFRRHPSVLIPCNPWRTLAGFSRGCMDSTRRFFLKNLYCLECSCSLNCTLWQLCHVWLDRIRKYTRCSFLENTANVQWIRCSPKGSHLSHWTSAVFSPSAPVQSQFTQIACRKSHDRVKMYFPILHSNKHRLYIICAINVYSTCFQWGSIFCPSS